MRKIPSSMATQHPDAASKFVPISEEPEEAITVFERPAKGIGCDEYLIDFMGKLTPYHQIGSVIKKLKEQTDLVPGEDVFITPRMVSDFYDEPFRQLITLLAVMEGIYYSSSFYKRQGVIEIIQAATEDVNELVKCHHRSNSFFPLLKKELNLKTSENELRLIPLFEGIISLEGIQKVLSEYIPQIGIKDYLRVFIGKSETAISAGHVSSVLACKLAINDCIETQDKLGIEIFPILGGGALPFRGFIAPENVDNFTQEYRGVKTYTIQSALRYDRDKSETMKMVSALREKTRLKPLDFSKQEKKKIREMMEIFSKNYLKELYEIIDYILDITPHVPDQRERIREYGDVTYYRSIRRIEKMLEAFKNKKIISDISQLQLEKFGTLPRAIKLSAALYSLGLPPEFLGTGNSLDEIRKEMGEEYLNLLLDRVYPSLGNDITFSSRFYTSSKLVTPKIQEGIKILDATFPFDEPEENHRILSKIAFEIIAKYKSPSSPRIMVIDVKDRAIAEYLPDSAKVNLSKLILDMGKIRGALG
ncbi:phosphoenolpyruvate carboxylase [[Eubacterium] cellulosolvens]